MCDEHDINPLLPVRLYRCQHGTMHLNLGHATFHLSPRELLLIQRAIDRWFHEHPEHLTDALEAMGLDTGEGLDTDAPDRAN
ncbi:MAG: hypothetical protein WD768_07195 [Phycisphaeraceae bacterium]